MTTIFPFKVNGQYLYTHSSSVWDGITHDNTGNCQGGFYATYAIDRRTMKRGGSGRRCNGFLHSSYEPYPWMAVRKLIQNQYMKITWENNL